MARPRQSERFDNQDKRREAQAALTAGDRLTEAPPPPDTLSSAAARQEWEALMPTAVALGTVCRADLRAFEMLCETLASATELQEIIRADGLLIPCANGGKKPHPAQRSLETARTQAHKLMVEFGLTPKARNYVKRAPEPREESGFVDI